MPDALGAASSAAPGSEAAHTPILRTGAGIGRLGKIARITTKRALGFGVEVLFASQPPGDRTVSQQELDEFAGKVRKARWGN